MIMTNGLTTREQLIQWAGYCNGYAGEDGSFSGPDYDRAFAMTESVGADTRTAADRIRFYLRFVIHDWTKVYLYHGHPGQPVVTAADRWHWLSRTARWSRRFGDTGGERSRDRFLEQLVFELTA